jgi:hypothetical protein
MGALPHDSFTIDEASMPRSIAEDRDGVFAGMMAVRNAIEVAAYGIPEVAVGAEEMLPPAPASASHSTSGPPSGSQTRRRCCSPLRCSSSQPRRGTNRAGRSRDSPG